MLFVPCVAEVLPSWAGPIKISTPAIPKRSLVLVFKLALRGRNGKLLFSSKISPNMPNSPAIALLII